MKVLVTGGAGYIGSIVTGELIKSGHDVVVFDNLQTGHREAVDPLALFVEGDLGNAAIVDSLFARHRFDAVLHFASNTLVGESMELPFRYLGDNVCNALNLVRGAADHGVKRFVLSSTANLFDRPERTPISEDELIVPGSPYGESKRMIEQMLHWTDRIYGMRYACLRYFNAAGAVPTGERGEDHTPEHHLIPTILQVALGQRDHVTIFGDDYATPDGTCVRDYVHVLDLAQAHLLALEALDNGSRVYNLGNGQGFSVLEVIQTAREVTGRSIPVRTGRRRPGDPAVLIADSTRIQRDLGWSPKHATLRAIVGTAWNWHRTHPEGYRPTSLPSGRSLPGHAVHGDRAAREEARP